MKLYTSGYWKDAGPLKIVTIPGLYGSGPTHWQTRWEHLYGYSRIEQDEWCNPDYDQWAQKLIRYLETDTSGSEFILVAHSLGCHLVVKSFPMIKERVKGMFLVAPPDLGAGIIRKDLSGFSLTELPQIDTKGCLIYSEDDPYASIAYSEKYGGQLGLNLINVGKRGHINSDSYLGNWDEGALLLNHILQSIRLTEPVHIFFN